MKILRSISRSPSPRFKNLCLLLCLGTTIIAQKFEPYALNGGLVSAIAGRDYVMIASDTRLTDGGYEILTREYMTGRIWESTGATHTHRHIHGQGNNSNHQVDVDDDTTADDIMPFVEALVQDDGSITIPKEEASVPGTEINKNNGLGLTDEILEGTNSNVNIFTRDQCPTFIASSGCASDCEALKRQIRSEISAHKNWNHGDSSLTPTGIATLLGQTLYSRRTFPFYSFCILAGLEDVDTNRNAGGMGCVHIYDAIGSHERVAVATAGNGREMLQPILDRMFATTTSNTSTRTNVRFSGDEEKDVYEYNLPRDDRVVHASKQRIGLSLRPPVETYVTCNENEALALLVRGYRSVAEKEISIGDNLVVCILKKSELSSTDIGEMHVVVGQGDEEAAYCKLQVLCFPLKKH